MMGNIGEIIGLDDTVISGGRFVLERPQPGEITVENSATQGPLQNQEQGVYTCRIPDSTNTIQNVNVGIYITGFNSELYTTILLFSQAMYGCLLIARYKILRQYFWL